MAKEAAFFVIFAGEILLLLVVVNRSEILPLPLWRRDFAGIRKPFLIAGPCSAESEEQVLAIARQLHRIEHLVYFRAGLWKPRTRPDSFEGVGHRGIPWLLKAREQYGIKIITEVATPQHLEKVLKARFDAIWIGARTTANPFAVQELAEALKGVDIPVFVKNPVSPDLELWIGALERINKAGIKRLAAIHRGFSNYEKTQYRNLPQWQIPIDLKTYIPEITLLSDPSHISGDARFIFELSQEAMDLDFDGLMIETHIEPENALSDAKQQITPDQLKSILQTLVIRNSTISNADFYNEIEELRRKIDILDDHLLVTLEQRIRLVEKIGKLKQANNITILQSTRWKKILNDAVKKAKKKNIDPVFINKIFKLIHQEAISVQAKIMNKKLRK